MYAFHSMAIFHAVSLSDTQNPLYPTDMIRELVLVRLCNLILSYVIEYLASSVKYLYSYSLLVLLYKL